jgi:cytochrome c peroxidase
MRLVAALLLSLAALAAGAGGAAADGRDAFRRPAGPAPAAAGDTPAMVALGRRLFFDAVLSGDGTLSCSSCHDPLLGYSDGVARGKGVTGTRLPRRTPSLWNAGWNETFFWDGRARSAEEQARGPIENPDEMGGDLAAAARKLAADPSYAAEFAAAFPAAKVPAPGEVVRALSAFERTLNSPATRFDRFAAGDDGALDAKEKAGFRLFTGKAGCSVCHTGWAFTDQAFHDVGLAGDDLGRGKVIGLSRVDHAFKTPSLRETAWTAPYMHDGSLASLDAVVAHYQDGVVRRPSLSDDMPKARLGADERAAVVAFLRTLSSDDPAALPFAPGSSAPPPAAGPAVRTGDVSQRDRTFAPGAIVVEVGKPVSVFNDDTRTHNVRLDEGVDAFNAGEQQPGHTVTMRFSKPGSYQVYCGIHPRMKLDVEVIGRGGR